MAVVRSKGRVASVGILSVGTQHADNAATTGGARTGPELVDFIWPGGGLGGLAGAGLLHPGVAQTAALWTPIAPAASAMRAHSVCTSAASEAFSAPKSEYGCPGVHAAAPATIDARAKSCEVQVGAETE